MTAPHEGERSLETQLPFLQPVLGREVAVLPVLVPPGGRRAPGRRALRTPARSLGSLVEGAASPARSR